jgi:hypothetical protein
VAVLLPRVGSKALSKQLVGIWRDGSAEARVNYLSEVRNHIRSRELLMPGMRSNFALN